MAEEQRGSRGKSYGNHKSYGSGRPGNRGGKGFKPRGNGGKSYGHKSGGFHNDDRKGGGYRKRQWRRIPSWRPRFPSRRRKRRPGASFPTTVRASSTVMASVVTTAAAAIVAIAATIRATSVMASVPVSAMMTVAMASVAISVMTVTVVTSAVTMVSVVAAALPHKDGDRDFRRDDRRGSTVMASVVISVVMIVVTAAAGFPPGRTMRRDFHRDRDQRRKARSDSAIFTREEKMEYREAKRGEYLSRRVQFRRHDELPVAKPVHPSSPGEPKMPKGMEWSMLSKDDRERLRGLSKEHAENIGLHILAAFTLGGKGPRAGARTRQVGGASGFPYRLRPRDRLRSWPTVRATTSWPCVSSAPPTV